MLYLQTKVGEHPFSYGSEWLVNIEEKKLADIYFPFSSQVYSLTMYDTNIAIHNKAIWHSQKYQFGNEEKTFMDMSLLLKLYNSHQLLNTRRKAMLWLLKVFWVISGMEF